MGVEWGEVAENVQRFAFLAAHPQRLLERLVERLELTRYGLGYLGRFLMSGDDGAHRPAHNHFMGRYRAPVHGELGATKQRADRIEIVPPTVVVTPRNHLGSGKSIQPLEIQLEVPMVSRHG